MTIRLLVSLPPYPPGAILAFDDRIEDALVLAQLASNDLAGGSVWTPPPAELEQIPLLITPITAAQRAEPSGGMLAKQYAVFDDGYEWLRVNAAGDDLIPIGEPALGGTRLAPRRNGLVRPTHEFRGAADSANSLGVLGLIVNADSDTAAGTRFAAGDVDYQSTLSGASSGSRSIETPFLEAAVLRVHVAVVGLSGYSVVTSGPATGAGMVVLEWPAAANVRWLQWDEAERTNYAGTPGTGSARSTTVMGISGG